MTDTVDIQVHILDIAERGINIEKLIENRNGGLKGIINFLRDCTERGNNRTGFYISRWTLITI
jgi:hypothetical protein